MCHEQLNLRSPRRREPKTSVARLEDARPSGVRYSPNDRYFGGVGTAAIPCSFSRFQSKLMARVNNREATSPLRSRRLFEQDDSSPVIRSDRRQSTRSSQFRREKIA